MKHWQTSKKEIIDTMRNELDTVEERFKKVINENNMVGEDYRMRASVNWEALIKERVKNETLENFNTRLSGRVQYLTKLND
jgi:hypothetical protein